MNQLPIISDCGSCGACCLEQGSPPGYLWLLQLDNHSAWPDQEDVERVKSLPVEAMRYLRTYENALLNGAVNGDGPCCWYDPKTRGCRFYEHRPQICRDFEVGCGDCLNWREKYRVRATEPDLKTTGGES